MPNSAVTIIQCLKAGLDAGCVTAHEVVVTATSTGTLPATKIVVKAGAIVGSRSCGRTILDADGCSLLLAQAGSQLAFAPISFGPHLTVTPNIDLHGGSAVSVSGAGLPKSTPISLAECLDVATSASGCDTTYAVAATTTATGALAKTTFDVVSGSIGTGTCGTAAYDDNACKIVAVDSLDNPLAATAISFGPTVTVTPASGLSGGTTVTVSAFGLIPKSYYSVVSA